MVKETYEEIYKKEFIEDENEAEEIELEMIFDFFIHDNDVQFSADATFVNGVAAYWFKFCCITEKQEALIRKIYRAWMKEKMRIRQIKPPPPPPEDLSEEMLEAESSEVS